MSIYHAKTVTIADDPLMVAAGGVVPSDYNAAHIINVDGTTIHTHANKTALDAYNSTSFAGAYHNHQAGIERNDITNLLPAITEGTGTFTVATGQVWMFDDVDMDVMSLHTIAASGTLTPADDTTTYVCADANTNQWVLLTALTSIDYIRYVPYFIVFKRAGSTSLHTQIIALVSHGEIESSHQRILSCQRYARESGYEQISVDGSLNLTTDAGVIWSVNTRYSPGPISAATRQFPCYRSGGVWIVGTTHTVPVVDNLYYDNGTDKVALGSGQWVINYIYRGIEDQDHMYTVLSNTFTTIEEAKASAVIGNLPAIISAHAVLIGRVIVQQSQTVDAANIESAFTATFAAATPVTAHNDLTGIMGDAAGYHINGTQYSNVTNAPTFITSGATSSFLAADGQYRTIAAGTGGGGSFTLNGQTSPQILTVASGLTQQTATSGQTFGIATSYSTQFEPINVSSRVMTFTNKTINDVTNYVDSDAVHAKVFNNSGGALTAGQAVYNATWNVANTAPEVGLAQANAAGTCPCHGLIEAGVSNGAVGSIRTHGILNNIDTSIWSEGTDLWLSPVVAGGLTSTEPTTSGQYKQFIGTVIRQHATLGVIEVNLGPAILIVAPFSLNAQTANQTLTVGAGLSQVTATSGQTFQIATSYGAQFQTTGNYASTNHSHNIVTSGAILVTNSSNSLTIYAPVQTGNFLTTNASSSFAIQTATTVAANSSNVLMGNGGWSSIPTQTASLVNTSAIPLLASITTGTVAGQSMSVGTAAGAMTISYPQNHTHAYQAAGNYISTGATTGYGTNVPLQTTTATASNSYLQANGAWGGVTAAVGSQYATQSVSTGASSHVLYGDGRWASVAGGVGGGDATSTNHPVNSLFAGTGVSATLNATAFNLSVATNYQAQGNYASTNATNFASQTVSSGASSHVLMGNGGWSSIPTQTASLVNTSAVPLLASINTGTTTGANGAIATAAGAATVYFANSTSYAPVSHTHTSYAQQTATTVAANSSNVLMGNGGWSSIPTQTASLVNTSAVPLLASLTTGTVTGQALSIGTAAGAATVYYPSTHTHAYQAAGNYASTDHTHSSYAVQTATTVAGDATKFLRGDGAWATVGGGGTQYATQSVSTGASSHVLYGDGRWASVAGGAVTNNYSGVLEIHAGAGIYSSGTMDIQAGSNITIATNAGGVTINGAGGVTLSGFDYPKHWKMATTGSTMVVTTTGRMVHLKHLELANNVYISAIDWPVVIGCGSTTSGTQSVTINATAVLYTMNGGTLVPFNAAVFTTGTTFTSNGTATIVGNRMLHMPLASTTVLTPNDYWVGYQMQATGWTSVAITNVIASGSVPALFMNFGSLSVTTTGRGGIFEPQGMLATNVSMSNTTNTWATTDVNMGAASWYRANIPVLIRGADY